MTKRNMKSETIKAYYINPKTDTACECDIVDSLDVFYDMLDCGTIDIVNRAIGRYGQRRYDIICDDEGLMKDDPYISAIDKNGQPMLVGSLLVVGEADDDGNITSLDDDDIKFLKMHTENLSTYRHVKPYPMLVHMEY